VQTSRRVRVERSKLTDTLIVEATCNKFIEHQPLERQCSRFSREGVAIAPQTLGRGVAAHLDLWAPVARTTADLTRGPGLPGTDATSIPVIDRNSADNIRNGAMWCCTNAWSVTFFYSPSGEHP
jgi:hypothetical protein